MNSILEYIILTFDGENFMFESPYPSNTTIGYKICPLDSCDIAI